MFGSKKKTEEPQTYGSKTTALPSGDNALNSLVRGTVTEGHVTAESDIRIDGIIKGTLTCAAKVIIGPSGFVEGEIKCQNAMIEGKFHGRIRVAELLTVNATADVQGDVVTNKLVVVSGATFNVTCDMKSEPINVKTAKLEAATANGTA